MAVSDLFFGSYTVRNKRRISKIVSEVNSLSNECASLTDEVFAMKTNEFRNRLRNGESIESILPEALAVCREATKRVTLMYHYDVQIEAAISMIGAVISNDGKREHVIAEMKTGEGKTLVQILVAYLNALEATKDEDKSKWKSVHVMTSNDALAKRDAYLNRKVYELLGLSCGFAPSRSKSSRMSDILDNLKLKKEAYNCDIVYATTSTVAFDYLTDNTILDKNDRIINKPFGYAIIDEADDLLIDQAINPLILSGKINGFEDENETEEIRNYYEWATKFLYGYPGIRIDGLNGKVFNQYEKNKHAEFSEDYIYYMDTEEVVFHSRIASEIGFGLKKDENREKLYNMRYVALMDAIRAKHSYLRNEQYEVRNLGEGKADIILTDQNTGRRKYSNKYIDGMQEAIEAKEEYFENSRVGSKKRFHIVNSNKLCTKAMCTYPDFLSLYEGRVSGMTGTSDIEEFKELYGFETYEVPSRKKNIRIDLEDEVYATLNQKYNAIVNEVIKCRKTLEPVLIGTTSIEESKIISNMLNQRGIHHQLLNAENEEEESKIIESAGLLGSVVVATNMAGRGTDIKLKEGAENVGGLYVIGTSKNKSVRIDRQLRGRSARQGDPGKTKYFSSLEDQLVKLHYPGDTLKYFIDYYKKGDGRVLNKTCLKAVNKSQLAKESKDKEQRIASEKFNKVFTEHKKTIYEMRNTILDAGPVELINYIKQMMVKYTNHVVDNESTLNIEAQLSKICNVKECESNDNNIFKKNLVNNMYANFRSNFAQSGVQAKDIIKYYKNVQKKMLCLIDIYWANHFDTLEYLKKKMAISFGVNDVFKDYEMEANRIFAMELMPSLLNEILTYAVNPNMKLGEYEIEYDTSSPEYTKVLV